MSLIEEIKKKREFSGLPDSVIERAVGIVMNTDAPLQVPSEEGNVKEVRALLRKYFGVFLTNRVLRGKGDLLGSHMSSKKRNYGEFYGEIFSQEGMGPGYMNNISSVIDLGAGVNGFSYGYLKDAIGPVRYVAVEAAGQEVDHMNKYFEESDFDAEAFCLDLFDVNKIKDVLKKQGRDRVVFLFQVVDALESLERDFSKRFLLEISKECEWIVLSLPTESLGGRKKFEVQRKWMMDFLSSKDDPGGPCENFLIKRDFLRFGERIIILKNKK